MERAITMSHGGGRQTTAMIVLILQGRLQRPERIVMADTGREQQETWDYLDEIVQPALARVGMQIEIAAHDLATVDLYSGNGDVLIPGFTEDGKLPTFCSSEWKKFVVRRRLRELGYGPEKPVITWIGMSRDELGRLKPSGVDWQENRWPLALDLRMSKHDCIQTVLEYGWPEPPHSSCYMCPHRQNSQWRHLQQYSPGDWQKAVALDTQVYESHGIRLHETRQPLADVNLSEPDDPQIPMFGDHNGCDSGYCMV